MNWTKKQQAFCEEYLIDLNATQAAIRAGYSVKTACSIGLENLGKPLIAEYLAARMQERSERTEITQDHVLTTIHDTIEQCRKDGPAFDPGNVLKGCDSLMRHLACSRRTTSMARINLLSLRILQEKAEGHDRSPG